MGKRKFYVEFDVDGIIEIDDAVIDVVDDEWRSYLYNLYTPEEIALHVAYGLLNNWKLSSLDGWADQPDENARIFDVDWMEQNCYEIKDD